MCELLIKAVDATHWDAAKNEACYKRGDVVVAVPDGHEWGREEAPPKFIVVRIPDLSVIEAVKQYITTANPHGIRREWKIDISTMAHGSSMSAKSLSKLAKHKWR